MKLIYFTNSYPYGLGELWKANELNILVRFFSKIVVVPFSYDGNFDNPKSLPDGVELIGPLVQESGVSIRKTDLVKVLFSSHVIIFLREFFSRRVYKNKSHVISWLVASLNVIRLLKNKKMKKLLEDADDKTILYFYWGKGSCEVLPFINCRRYYKTFVRMHRYDLFEYTNNNYIPYRGRLLDSIDIAAPSSIAGELHLKELYPKAKASIQVVRCGTLGNGKTATPSGDAILRIVSCSLLSPVKRVHLMIESLQYVDFPVLWRHIGDGAMMNELKDLVMKLGLEKEFIFEGIMNSNSIIDFYANNVFDVFVNVSESEGVPFSIMEAFSAGIPVIATGVGGTGEIVDANTGRLINKDISALDLAFELKQFYLKTDIERQRMRAEVYDRYNKLWNAEKLTNELVHLLKK